MDWCLTALNYYLNQCWHIIHEVLWNSPKGNLMGYYQYIYPWYISQGPMSWLSCQWCLISLFGHGVLTCCSTVMRHKLWFYISTNSPPYNHKFNLWFFSGDHKWNPFVMFCIISRCEECWSLICSQQDVWLIYQQSRIDNDLKIMKKTKLCYYVKTKLCYYVTVSLTESCICLLE